MIKVVLGLIVLSFLLFFGYTQISSNNRGGTLVAVVEERPITRTQFDFSYKHQTEQFQKDGQKSLPKNLQEFIQHNILEGLVQELVTLYFAESLGIGVSDRELAELIRSHPFTGGAEGFDLTAYREQARPYFRRQYGIDFEDYLTRQTLLKRLQGVLDKTLFAIESPDWKKDFETLELSLEKITVDPEILKNSSAEEAEKVATHLFSLWKSDTLTEAELTRYGLIKETTPLTKILDKAKIVPAGLSPTASLDILTLTEHRPYATQVYGDEAGRFFLFKFKELHSTPPVDLKSQLADSAGRFAQEAMQLWLKEFRNSLEIQTFTL